MVGAYKTAPTRCLETEAWVPPLDLYLNKRLADFERRLRTPLLHTGRGPEAEEATAASIVVEACNRLYTRFRRRKKRGQRARQGP